MASKEPKRITLPRLRNVARAYVERFGGSRARLSDVLRRRAERSLRFHDELARMPEVEGFIATVIGELSAEGLCDDRRRARAEAVSQALCGRPRRVIRQRLRLKGFDDESIAGALQALDVDTEAGAPDADFVACCRYARRRGLGPFARPGGRVRETQQQLAALMRAGFGYGHARRVLDATDRAELEAFVDGARLPRL